MDVDFWVGVMKVAHFIGCQPAKMQAKDRLIFRLDYTNDQPVPAITFGLKYKIQRWFEAGFRALVKQPFSSFSAEDSEKIGWRVAAAVHKTQLAVLGYRHQVAFLPPRVTHDLPTCGGWARETECEKEFERGWWLEVGRLILDPQYPDSCDELKEKLATFKFPGLNPRCWERTLAQRGTWDHIFDREEVILAECTERAQQQFGPWFEID